MIDFFFRGL